MEEELKLEDLPKQTQDLQRQVLALSETFKELLDQIDPSGHMDQFLYIEDVAKMTKFESSTIRTMLNKGNFPKPRNKVGKRNVWSRNDIIDHMLGKSPAANQYDSGEALKKMRE
jgi:predicted DNA-binding transcriptional regulator AlpA